MLNLFTFHQTADWEPFSSRAPEYIQMTQQSQVHKSYSLKEGYINLELPFLYSR